jgi:hypothetical protein
MLALERTTYDVEAAAELALSRWQNGEGDLH